jgi:hypothetical protein
MGGWNIGLPMQVQKPQHMKAKQSSNKDFEGNQNEQKMVDFVSLIQWPFYRQKLKH